MQKHPLQRQKNGSALYYIFLKKWCATRWATAIKQYIKISRFKFIYSTVDSTQCSQWYLGIHDFLRHQNIVSSSYM